MSISVIIPTYNGAYKILSLLEALTKQTHHDFETIVVIDGSQDNTIEIVQGLKTKLNDFKIITQKNKGRAATRNAGAQQAKGSLLIFFDDDVEPLDNVVALHIKHHLSVNDSILVGNLNMDIRGEKNDFYDYRFYIEQKWNAKFSQGTESVSFQNYRFTSQNLSMSKELFFSLGGFDERFSDSEDFDLSMKALLRNIPIYFNSNIFAWHRDFIDMKGYIKRQKEYLISKQKLLKIHPQYSTLYSQTFAFLSVHKFKRFIGNCFIYNKFWNTVIQSLLFKVLPQKIRYRLYDIIIFSNSIQ